MQLELSCAPGVRSIFFLFAQRHLLGQWTLGSHHLSQGSFGDMRLEWKGGPEMWDSDPSRVEGTLEAGPEKLKDAVNTRSWAYGK